MSFGCDNHRIESLNSYADAKAFYEKTERPGGKTWGVLERPLDRNSMHHKRLVKVATGYACVLFRTALVTYNQDGIVIVACHDSVSSRSFMDRVLPTGLRCFCRDGRTWIHVTGSTENYTGAALEFKPYGSAWELIRGANKLMAPKADPKAMAAVRKVIRPFELWVKAVERLTGKPPQRTTVGWKNLSGHAYEILFKDPHNPAFYTDVWNMITDVDALREAGYWADGAKTFASLPLGVLPAKGVRTTNA